MKKQAAAMIMKVLEKSITKEANSVCVLLGYQPKMPDEVKKFKNKKR